MQDGDNGLKASRVGTQLELCLGAFPLPPAGVSLPPAGVSLALKPNKSHMVDLLYFPYENHQFDLVTQS